MEDRNRLSLSGKVCVVTVTYGDRADFVQAVVQRLRLLAVGKVIIIDNNSGEASRNKLKLLAADNPVVEVVSFATNLGSAGGFKQGLIKAVQSGCEFIWMLDDDNLPEEHALSKLLDVYQSKGQECCLVSLRRNRLLYRKIFNEKDVLRKFNPVNGFINYSLVHAVRKKFLYSRKRSNVVPIPYGPYGGMFFPSAMLDHVELPMEEMYLYRDDHEFSHRFVKSGFPIYLCRESIVDDLEVSWQGRKHYKFFSRYMNVIDGDEMKAYYMVRNSVFFERKYYVTSRFEYAINQAVYTSMLYLICLFKGKMDRFKLFKKALADSKTLLLTTGQSPL